MDEAQVIHAAKPDSFSSDLSDGGGVGRWSRGCPCRGSGTASGFALGSRLIVLATYAHLDGGGQSRTQAIPRATWARSPMRTLRCPGTPDPPAQHAAAHPLRAEFFPSGDAQRRRP